jgi:hypothetical protein
MYLAASKLGFYPLAMPRRDIRSRYNIFLFGSRAPSSSCLPTFTHLQGVAKIEILLAKDQTAAFHCYYA